MHGGGNERYPKAFESQYKVGWKRRIDFAVDVATVTSVSAVCSSWCVVVDGKRTVKVSVLFGVVQPIQGRKIDGEAVHKQLLDEGLHSRHVS